MHPGSAFSVFGDFWVRTLASHASLDRVGELEEERPLRAAERLPLVQRALVTVPDEQRRLPVEPVAEQRRAGELGVPPRDVGEEQARIAAGGDVLPDQADECAGI